MQGIEVVLARLASTVVSTLAKSVLAPKPGAGLVTDPVRPLPKPPTPDKLALVLSGRIAAGYAALPEHERLAAVAAVQDTFATADLTADHLFGADLDPRRLCAELPAPDAGLSTRALDLYAELLGLCCAHLVEQLTAHPSFAARAAVEQTRRSGRTEELLRELSAGPRPEALALDFEQRYADFVAETQSRLELFGITLGDRRRAEWPLDTAYISLAVSGDRRDDPRREVLGLPDMAPTALKVEQALADCDRLVLRGPAGSGKSTLVQWLALNAARRSFGPELAAWNLCVPFVLRLRSFNTPDGLPMPEDFLSSSGVPLQAPSGWTSELLTTGRALVLVDGVDEVPTRLRGRTESWLKSLIAAYPKARYVVTTRSAAVPEDWLAGQGFTAHSLLPMEREDIRAFIGHWHDSARLECLSEAERSSLDMYEAGLNQAVTSRRDLARLATNPLMCALLCALNRDRRMRLPRARKELYDAALDMLLVHRDIEREITSVEGVVLSRDEQTALLQRLAYWLIRNGQVEASREDAVSMLDEWLDSMPQVREQGDAEQVFSHLLIRSGLLREPVPGYVDFVHRTFQDYLGAKAAVESRDFGVLVRNAHDDQWDDVVRMAVGHARVEERGRLLRQLLRRADKVRRYRERLVLLAAASLEHAPELGPDVRREVEERTAELVPPRSMKQADALSKAGELVLELLPGPEGLTDREAAAVVRTAGLIGGDAALEVISRFRADQRLRVRTQLDLAWPSFDINEYFETVLDGTVAAKQSLTMSSPEQLALLPRLPQLSALAVQGDHGLPDAVLEQTALEFLNFIDNDSLSDLSPLRQLPNLETLALNRCRSITDLGMLSELPLKQVNLSQPAERLSLAPLGDSATLRHLIFDFAPVETALGDLPFGPELTGIGFYHQAAAMKLSGIDAFTSLKWLAVNETHQWLDFLAAGVFSRLHTLLIIDVPHIDLAHVLPHQDLTSVYLSKIDQVHNLSTFAELRDLKYLQLARCGPIDLTPLAPFDNVSVHLYDCPQALGTDLFPPHRLTIE
ncbi:NACHT domain-containing protein [Streptomyces tailanensis]|uniref:NACHT domain-containing protein n=1 Tax=Streptomyces tailanensis TaxID=2569858 RepID=UPI00122DF2DC|nr:NACHT domain-containing protein [Streptomyces tailanensis]